MRYVPLALLLFLLPSTILAQDPVGGLYGRAVEPYRPAEGPLKMWFELVDGSRVNGTPVEKSGTIAFRTHLGTVNVPFAKLARLEVANDRETTILHWPNGDRLTGFVDGDGVELDTVLGKLTVPWPAVSSAAVVSTPAPADERE